MVAIIIAIILTAIVVVSVLVMVCPEGGFHKFKKKPEGYVCKKCDMKPTLW